MLVVVAPYGNWLLLTAMWRESAEREHGDHGLKRHSAGVGPREPSEHRVCVKPSQSRGPKQKQNKNKNNARALALLNMQANYANKIPGSKIPDPPKFQS